jgi:hypothetical protein
VNACNPLLQAHPAALGAGQHEGRGFPSLFSPLCVLSRADPSGLGHTATIYSSVQGPPGVETPTKPFDPLADPETKEAIDIINVAESIIDEVVNKLLNEVAEKVLKEN